MRTLVLLLLVIVLVLAVLRFFPAGEAKGKETGTSGADTSSPFLQVPEEAPTSAPEGAGVAVTVPEDEDAPVDAPRATTAGQGSEDGPTWDPRLEVALAGALLHGTRGELESAVAALGRSLPPGRAALVLAFQRAMAGDLGRARKLAADVDPHATTDEERRLFEIGLGGRGTAPRPASFSSRREGPVALAMAIALRDEEAARALDAKDWKGAASAYSDVLQGAIDAPWEAGAADLARWSTALGEAQKHERWSPQGDWPSETIQVEPGDSLIRIRARYLAAHPDRLMCTGLIREANDLQGDTIHPGDELRIPTDPAHVVADLSSRWVLYFLDDQVAAAWPCAVGREGEETITGDFTAGTKITDPPWTPVGKPMVPYGDPANPLGTRWITWVRDGKPTNYGFHGTWDPASIGTAASDGCIRLHNEDVERLFEILPVGAPILVQE